MQKFSKFTNARINFDRGWFDVKSRKMKSEWKLRTKISDVWNVGDHNRQHWRLQTFQPATTRHSTKSLRKNEILSSCVLIDLEFLFRFLFRMVSTVDEITLELLKQKCWLESQGILKSLVDFSQANKRRKIWSVLVHLQKHPSQNQYFFSFPWYSSLWNVFSRLHLINTFVQCFLYISKYFRVILVFSITILSALIWLQHLLYNVTLKFICNLLNWQDAPSVCSTSFEWFLGEWNPKVFLLMISITFSYHFEFVFKDIELLNIH